MIKESLLIILILCTFIVLFGICKIIIVIIKMYRRKSEVRVIQWEFVERKEEKNVEASEVPSPGTESRRDD